MIFPDRSRLPLAPAQEVLPRQDKAQERSSWEEDVARRLLESNETLSVHSWNRGGGISMGEVGEGTIYGRLVGGGDTQFDRFFWTFYTGFAALPCGLRRRQRRRGQRMIIRIIKCVVEVNT